MDGDDAETDKNRTVQPSGLTIFIHWWHESGAIGSAEEGQAFRGTVRDLSGRTLGAFAGFDALFGLLRRIMGERSGPPH